MIEELKKQYDGQALDSIEALAEKQLGAAKAWRRRFVELLYYLRHTNRWRENAQYADASFDAYLRGRFMMTESAFDKERRAYICFPEETVKYGAGAVNRAIGRVGMHKAAKIFKRLPDGATIERIEKEVAKHAPAKKEYVSGGPTKAELQKENDRLKNLVHDLRGMLAEREQQIARLKNALQRYKADSDFFQMPAGVDVPKVGVRF